MTSTEAMIYQLKNLKGKPLKQKLEHILTYFWLPILITLAILISLGSYIVHVVTMKDMALNVICVNAYSEDDNAKTYLTDFALASGIDLEEYEVHISTDLTLSDADMMTSYDTVQVLIAQTAARSVDILAGDVKNITRYFYQEMYWELDQILTPEQLENYKDYFLYADRAVIRQLDEITDTVPAFPDPTKPEEMKEPVAVALRVPADSEFLKTCYPNFKNGVAVGIVSNTENLANAQNFLKYVME